MLEEIVEGFFVDPELVAVVKATGENECAVFTAGQSAMDGGFKLDYSAKEVAQEINDALEPPSVGDEDESTDED